VVQNDKGLLPEELYMKNLIRLFFLFCLFSFTLTAQAGSPSTSLAPMLEKILPAVVNIRAIIKVTDVNTYNRLQRERGENKNKDDNTPQNEMPPDTFLSVGSGVIVDAHKGFILTNSHVIEDAQTVTVTLSDGHHYTAKVIGFDKPSDVAVLQIRGKNLTALTLSDSNSLKVGDVVAAIGNPFGLNQTVTSGIVSALGRTTLGIESFENFIQTDAPINPGNSGGALVDIKGELVGINTAILAPSKGSVGIGFAIPSNMAKSVMQQLIQFGNVKRGALGIGAEDINPELAAAFDLKEAKGAVVTQVISHTPAEKAGFQVGDIITNVNGAEIKSANDVVNAIGFLRVDSKATIHFLRDHKPLTITVSISDPAKRRESSLTSDPFFYGVGLKDFTLLSPIHGDVKGVLIVSVDEDSNASHADLRPGDVITSANQKKVTDINALKAIAPGADSTILLHILRGPGALFLVLNKEQ
jgi:serine protease Do